MIFLAVLKISEFWFFDLFLYIGDLNFSSKCFEIFDGGAREDLSGYWSLE